jgi:hypothetical protein
LAPVLTARTAARTTMAGVSPNIPWDSNRTHIEIIDNCGKAKRGLQSAPARSTLPPDELCAELGELETHVARTRLPQIAAIEPTPAIVGGKSSNRSGGTRLDAACRYSTP